MWNPCRYWARPAPTRATSSCGVMPSLSALSMMGAPCASSAQTKCSSCPCIRWKRTQISAWMYSIMWPMCSGPLAYGRAVVTKILRGMRLVYTGAVPHPRSPSITPDRGLLPYILDRLELGLVDALLVGLLAGDLPRVQQLLDRGVHGAHAVLGARLHHVLELIQLALSDQVRRGRRVDEDLERGDPAAFVRFLQQLLRDHAAQRRREHRAHVRLLVGREHVDHAVDGLRCAVGVQGAHDQDAHLGRGNRNGHRLEVAQLTYQDDIRVFAQSRVQCPGEALRVHADL